jgi:hypothetical protein
MMRTSLVRQTEFLKKNNGQFSMIGHNISGLSKKEHVFELLQETLSYSFDILGFTETH